MRGFTKRILSMALSLCLCLTMLPAAAIKVNAYSDAYTLPPLTGDQAQDTAAIALSQVGYTYSDGTVYGAWWNTVTNWGVDYTYSGWCTMFACWCANQAGAGIDIAYDKYSAVVSNLLSWLEENASADVTFSSAPQPGDFIFFSNSKGGSAAHVAVVIDYDDSTNIVTFVGGNQSSKVTKETVKWSETGKYYKQYLMGYGRPNYGTGTEPENAVTSQDAIALLYAILYPEEYPQMQPADFDGSGEITTEDAVYLLKYSLFPELYPLKHE